MNTDDKSPMIQLMVNILEIGKAAQDTADTVAADLCKITEGTSQALKLVESVKDLTAWRNSGVRTDRFTPDMMPLSDWIAKQEEIVSEAFTIYGTVSAECRDADLTTATEPLARFGQKVSAGLALADEHFKG
jgi:hypothetical protein